MWKKFLWSAKDTSWKDDNTTWNAFDDANFAIWVCRNVLCDSHVAPSVVQTPVFPFWKNVPENMLGRPLSSITTNIHINTLHDFKSDKSDLKSDSMKYDSRAFTYKRLWDAHAKKALLMLYAVFRLYWSKSTVMTWFCALFPSGLLNRNGTGMGEKKRT